MGRRARHYYYTLDGKRKEKPGFEDRQEALNKCEELGKLTGRYFRVTTCLAPCSKWHIKLMPIRKTKKFGMVEEQDD